MIRKREFNRPPFLIKGDERVGIESTEGGDHESATTFKQFAFMIIGLAQVVLAGPLPQEPSEAYLVHEDVNIITGLYTREYSLTGSGIVDYKTARQIIISEYNEYWNSVVETKEFPLFYWHDANHDGEFEMWVDQKVEVCSCDIHPYDPLQNNQNPISSLTMQ